MSEQLVKYLAPVEISYMLGINVKTVLSWLRDPSHPLKGAKVGNMWRIHPNDFANYMKGQQ